MQPKQTAEVGTVMKFSTRAIVCTAMLALSLAAYAKGNFQARGTLSDVQVSHGEIWFKFTGEVSVGYETAPEGHPIRKWQQMELRVIDLPMFIANWTEAYNSEKKSPHPPLDKLFATLS